MHELGFGLNNNMIHYCDNNIAILIADNIRLAGQSILRLIET